jgi:hypothetical protein
VITGFGHGGISPSILIVILFQVEAHFKKLLLGSLENCGGNR